MTKPKKRPEKPGEEFSVKAVLEADLDGRADSKDIRALFAFDSTMTDDEVLLRFQMWNLHFFFRFFHTGDAAFHREMDSQQFNDPSFKRHNGIDATTYGGPAYGQTWMVHCPVSGFVVESVSYEENGGGNQLSLISKAKVKLFERECYVRLWFCHAKKILVSVGYEPALGELIMIANNTGFSTGPHTHMGLYRLTDKKQKLDTNEATGSFDPSLFFTGTYAIDEATVKTMITNGMRYWKYLISA